MDRIPLALSLGTFGFLSYVALHHVDSLLLRMDEVERAAVMETRQAAEVKHELDRALGELERVRGELEVVRSDSLADRASTEGALRELSGVVTDQEERIELVRRTQEEFDPEALDASLKNLGRELTERWEAAFRVASTAAENGRTPDAGPQPGRTDLWRTLVGPIAQLAGEESVGSGILVRGVVAEGSDEPCDYVLTAWHVVRDIQGSLYNRDMPVPVQVYVEEGRTQERTAELLEFDADVDIALLRLTGGELVRDTARLPAPERLHELAIFDRVCAVGCPLGNDPIPTLGEIAATHHEVDGETYLMINAPTYVGNSGGGIFDAETRELLGVFSKVYTHGSLRPTIVTHMGLVTPLTIVYEWLEAVGYGFLVPAGGGQATPASAVQGQE